MDKFVPLNENKDFRRIYAKGKSYVSSSVRESVRHLTEDIKDGYDFVFVARAKTPFVKCPEVQRSMRKQLKEAGVLK